MKRLATRWHEATLYQMLTLRGRKLEPDQDQTTNISRRANFVLSVVWLLTVGVAYFFSWYYSIAFIAACSIYANFASHVAAWRSDANPNQEQLNRIEQMLKQLLDERS